jgi:hypothetical protein
VGSHRTPEEKRELQQRARELRAAGRSRREIQAELGIGDDLARAFLSGVPVPDSLARPRAKDAEREAAIAMRAAGATYDQISAELGVSKGSLSLWLSGAGRRADPVEARGEQRAPDGRRDHARQLRAEGRLLSEISDAVGISVKAVYYWTWDLPVPERARPGGDAAHMRRMSERRWAEHRRRRDTESLQRKLDAALSVGQVSDQALLLLGAVAYWCEGAKSKPWRRGKFVFVNSDPMLVRLMVRWLRLVGVPPARWSVRLQIHESADVARAEEYWRHVLGLSELVFQPVTLKRHKPLTSRKNTGDAYHGCVTIYVQRGVPLLEQVEGWVVGALLGCGGRLPQDPMRWGEEDKEANLSYSLDKQSAVG